MSNTTAAQSLLSELDARQDEVMRGLDELNRRIEQLMRSWTNGISVSDEAA